MSDNRVVFLVVDVDLQGEVTAVLAFDDETEAAIVAEAIGGRVERILLVGNVAK